MSPFYQDPFCTLYHGDCREILRALPEASVHAIVTDPPYELAFMGKRWDGTGVAFDPATWAECLRVLKPGGHLLAFGGTRTYHRMVCAIEDAGFEIRDQIAWTYGSGFPKSLDVSKAIDKARIEDNEPIRRVCRFVRAAMDATGLKSRHLVEFFNGCDPRLIDHWAARDTDSQPSLPTPDQWLKLKSALRLSDEMDAEVSRLNERKGEHSDAWNNAEVIGKYDGVPGGLGGQRFSIRDNKIRSLSDAAKEWDGWGTALKPAWEPICVARKPLDGTVAENVQAHGAGALNIDGCRIPTDGHPNREKVWNGTDSGVYGSGRNTTKAEGETSLGRWSANLIHDGSEEVVRLFPAEAGAFAPVKGTEPSKPAKNTYGEYQRGGGAFYGDSGSAARFFKTCALSEEDLVWAARFFYCAKASRSERGEGNTHPTVKPIELMRYLVRLVTPKGGMVVDPFTGSGTTGIACKWEGFRFIGIDREEEHCRIAAARMAEPVTVQESLPL